MGIPLNSKLTTVFVADAGGSLAVACTLAIIPNLTRGAKSFGIIENVVTHPSQRRSGLGRAVVAAALDDAWTAERHKVVLTGGRSKDTLRFCKSCELERGSKACFEVRRLQDRFRPEAADRVLLLSHPVYRLRQPHVPVR